MVDSMRPKCKQGVRLYYETELPDNYEVQTNQEGVTTLLKHLIENAIQYTDHGVITVKCEDYDDRVRTSVTDTGKGIPPERRPHVFDTFREMGDLSVGHDPAGWQDLARRELYAGFEVCL